MATIRIFPRYKLLMTYDVRPELYGRYQQYILDEFIPALQEMGMYMLAAWHTAYGVYPMRQVEFVMEDLSTARAALHDEKWLALEEKLISFTTNYGRRLVRYREGFQFTV